MIKGAATNQYASTHLDAVTSESNPAQLISALLGKSSTMVRRAVLVLRAESPQSADWEIRLKAAEEFNICIGKALDIVSALKNLLDLEGGGSLATQLEDTYSSILAGIWRASKDKDQESLQKLSQALNELKEAWDQIA